MFIGRERELASLNKLYDSDKFEFVVLYGRRRVGKTALINHFIDGKPAIYFMGVESNAKQNLENFSKSIMEYASGYDGDMSFLSFQAALEMVFRLSEKERLILAIDEYPYVARASKSLTKRLCTAGEQHRSSCCPSILRRPAVTFKTSLLRIKPWLTGSWAARRNTSCR